jgi:hypothetical protein
MNRSGLSQFKNTAVLSTCMNSGNPLCTGYADIYATHDLKIAEKFQPLYRYNIFRVLVTIDGFWIGNRIYWTV